MLDWEVRKGFTYRQALIFYRELSDHWAQIH